MNNNTTDCNCRRCNIKLVLGENWLESYARKNAYYCNDCYNLTQNHSRMFVDGKYIPKTHPLYKAGRYKSFNDAAFSSLENYNESKEGYVYIIANPAWPDWVKIGMAVDVEDRLKGYQTGSPMRDYELVYKVKTEDRRNAEREAHRQALKMCSDQKNEWFKISIIEAITILDNLNEPRPRAAKKANTQQKKNKLQERTVQEDFGF